MTKQDVLAFAQQHSLAVVATVTADNKPEAAVIGIAISDQWEIIFDTIEHTRKAVNLRTNLSVALVVGWDQKTLQLEGHAEVLSGKELQRCKEIYFSVFPDGHEREKWPGIMYVRVRPQWMRYSDFTGATENIVEYKFDTRS